MLLENSQVLMLVQILGTLAFAIAGAMDAIHRRLDLFGTLIIGVVTAAGGGIIRDVLIGCVPPRAFVDPFYLRIAALAALSVFLLVRFRFLRASTEHTTLYMRLLNITDAVGLGAFTVVGCETAVAGGYGANLLLTCFLGVTTGVGGGILRDVLTGHTPKIFVKHIYAVASICGALLFCAVREALDVDAAMILGFAVVVLIRILAWKYNLNLPAAWLEEE